MKVKVTIANQKKENNKKNVGTEASKSQAYMDLPVCVRCIIHSDSDILALNDVMHLFNTKYLADTNTALIRIGKGINDDGSLVIDIALATDNVEYTKSYLKNREYNQILSDMLFHEVIDHKFINFDDAIKNTSDIRMETDNEFNVCSFERAIIDDNAFDTICKYLIPNKDPSTISSIRIPCTSILYTMDSNWTKNVEHCDPVVSETINASDNMNIIVSIFDIENSNKFDELMLKIGDRCIINISADYTEMNPNNFFRAVHMTITTDIVGRSFYTTCHNYGAVKIVK